ncbi:aminotransferase class I/II-fold pyridoxal phosphate-dependent enzyme [Nocardia sp. NPDC003963]
MSSPAANPFPSTEMVSRSNGWVPRGRLSANENEFGPAPEVVAAITDAAAQAHHYPDCEHYDLRHALARTTGASFDQVHVRTGIDGLLGDICRRFAASRVVVTTAGTYATFGYFAAGVAARIETVPYRDLQVDSAALVRRAARDRAAVVYLAEPDNPTGSALGADEILALSDALPEYTLLIVDGAYTEYLEPGRRLGADDIVQRRMLWLRTFSKVYGLAGMRVGYALGAAALLDELRAAAEHYGVGRVAQLAALAALDATRHRDETLDRTASGRAHYTRELDAMGYRVLPGSTNFITVQCGPTAPAAALYAHLARARILTRAITGISENGLLRITIGPPAQRAVVLDALRSYRM